MSSKFCTQCGAANDPSAIFCNSCGLKFEQRATPQEDHSEPRGEPEPTPSSQQPPPSYQQPPQYAQQPPQYAQQPPQYAQQPPQYAQQPGYYQRHYGPDYVRPPGYVFTTSISQRIFGTLKRDIHVVEEIEERQDLQEEAIRLLLVCFSLLSVLSIIAIFVSEEFYDVISPTSTIIGVIARVFVGEFVFIATVASVGKSIGGFRTQVDRNEIIRVTSYAYVFRVFEQLLFVLAAINPVVGLIWIVAFIYFIILMVFVIRRALDTGYPKAIVTTIIAVIVSLIVSTIILIAVESIFGTGYELV
ncbi:MAG: zinc ribbon domain-containing protein [Candidatus Kariarchaeaceae archaeon]